MNGSLPLNLTPAEVEEATEKLRWLTASLGRHALKVFGIAPRQILAGDVARVHANIARWAGGVDSLSLGDDLTGKRREGYELAMSHVIAIAAKTLADPTFGMTLFADTDPQDLGA